MERYYDWALSQLNIDKAHKITRGSKDIIVAVIDLGYRHHPFMGGHLWVNPQGKESGLHGWDFEDNDESLEYSGTGEESSEYFLGHHVFVAGEVAACAPECPIMIVRVGYGNPDSWARGIIYAVDHGAKILIIPHGYLQGQKIYGVGLFYKGTDFGFCDDNIELIEALNYAYEKGCLIFSGTADNRGRRVACINSIDAVCAVGSSNKNFAPSDICCSADYVEFGAPAGQRSGMKEEQIMGCGGDNNSIYFTGGCMACAFAGGAAALIMSQFPELYNDVIRQIMRNTSAKPNDVVQDENNWEPKLGYGIIDVYKAVSLVPDQLSVILSGSEEFTLHHDDGTILVEIQVNNTGVFDTERVIAVLYNGNPSIPADDSGTLLKPAVGLQTRQIGHTIFSIKGFQSRKIKIKLFNYDPADCDNNTKRSMWLEMYSLKKNNRKVFRRQLKCSEI